MSLEETLSAIVAGHVAPLRAEIERLRADVAALRRSQPAALATPAEAARALGVSLSTVRRRVRDGSLPVRRVGRSVRIDLAAMHAPSEAEVLRLAREALDG